jgi:hypothetical protein
MEGAKNTWQKKRVDRMLVDQLLRSGNYTAAQELAESSGIKVWWHRGKWLQLFVYLCVCTGVGGYGYLPCVSKG